MSQNKFEIFHVLQVPLAKRNLIEASAGTGKTYSIAILVLRMLLEKQLHIKEILMVTFTKAAVAELEERIRQFLRSATRYAEGETIADETIINIAERSFEKMGRKETLDLLKEAILFLDEVSVMTIHSFCQQTLNEFAFETKQFFGAEVSNDHAEILEAETQKFWRRHVATMETELLHFLLEQCLSMSSISEIVGNQLNGKKFFHYRYDRQYTFSKERQREWLHQITTANQKLEQETQRITKYIEVNKDAIRESCLSNRYAKSHADKLENPAEFLEYISSNKEKKYIASCFPELLAESEEYEKAKEEQCAAATECLNDLYCFAIQEIEAAIRKYRLSVNQLTYDDLIENLHTALCKNENRELVAGLQRKYKAVFVDEFQDTDRQQYDIFDTAFAQNTIVFYIGDPKQSIYGWRKADIFTYFKAYDAVDNRYSMNINYRSTPELIHALNYFFYPQEDFDTFYFQASTHSIDYIPVEAPTGASKGNLFYDDKPALPVTLDTNFKKNDEIDADLAAQIHQLLTDKNFTIRINDKAKTVAPSDIGILVRSNSRGEAIRRKLAQWRIPAVTVLDAKVLQSPEAREMLHLLEAISDPSTSKINRALLSIFTGFHSHHILRLTTEETTELFKKYKSLWETRGIYEALMAFVSDFGVRNYLLHPQTENGERIITNLYHLIELLYKTASFKNYSGAELIKWLKRNLEKEQTEGDEWEQRIESDEDAVKIVTIHKSKGLQYPIVFAPQLDFTVTPRGLCTFKDEETNEYISGTKDDLSEEQLALFKVQQEQENRRLLYVALTRAVYKVFIYRNGRISDTTLNQFLNAVKADDQRIEAKSPLDLEKRLSYTAADKNEDVAIIENVHFQLLEPDWRRMSYSMLAARPEVIRRTNWSGGGSDYDRFVFKDLSKGMVTGNMLHYIFENIHFDNEEGWSAVVADALLQFAPAKRELEPALPELLRNVLEADVHGFSLNQVTSGKRIHELEFDFPVGLFTADDLAFLEAIYLKPFSRLEGMMNGKIDLFFEYDGIYYVLDWKSSYLGSSLEDYGAESVGKAMEENNYHLQYLIYTLAVKKYLESRLPDFDYERDFGGAIYCFVRGMRSGTDSGVFFEKPGLEVIERLTGVLEG